MKKGLTITIITVAIAYVVVYFVHPYFKTLPTACYDYFATQDAFLNELKTNPYASKEFIQAYEKKQGEFIGLFKQGIQQNNDAQKVKTICQELNSFEKNILERVKNVKSEKELRSLFRL